MSGNSMNPAYYMPGYQSYPGYQNPGYQNPGYGNYPGYGYYGQQPGQFYQQPPYPYFGGQQGPQQPPQQPQSLYDDREIAKILNSDPGDQLSAQDAKRNPGSTVIVEVDGPKDKHAQGVQDVYETHNPDGKNEIIGLAGEGTGESANAKPASGEPNEGEKTQLNNKEELDALIDAGASDSFNALGDRINEVVEKGDASVINASLGYSRNDIYEDTLESLQGNPELATHLGLKPEDITKLEKNEDGVTLITPEVAQGISKYVDARLDAEGSAYQKAKEKYQQTTENAAKNGVTVVVAAGNAHELNSVFERSTPGGDTNFLAQSDSVISVAATDNQDTKNIDDDTIADFSSHGDGKFNPTIATNGVGVETEAGPQDGTSFAAPKVAAVIARLQKENPDLTFDQIKALLQSTAYDSKASEEAEGAGILSPNAFLRAGQQGLPLAS